MAVRFFSFLSWISLFPCFSLTVICITVCTSSLSAKLYLLWNKCMSVDGLLLYVIEISLTLPLFKFFWKGLDLGAHQQMTQRALTDLHSWAYNASPNGSISVACTRVSCLQQLHVVIAADDLYTSPLYNRLHATQCVVLVWLTFQYYMHKNYMYPYLKIRGQRWSDTLLEMRDRCMTDKFKLWEQESVEHPKKRLWLFWLHGGSNVAINWELLAWRGQMVNLGCQYAQLVPWLKSPLSLISCPF